MERGTRSYPVIWSSCRCAYAARTGSFSYGRTGGLRAIEGLDPAHMGIRGSRSTSLISWESPVVAFAVIALMFLLKVSQVYSRGATLAFDVVALPLLLSLRVAVATTLERLMARQAVRGDPAIVLGIPDELARLSSRDLLKLWQL